MRDLEFNIRAADKTKPGFDAAARNARAFNGELDLAARGFQMAGNAARMFAAGFTLTAVADFGRTVREIVADAAGLVDLADKVGVTIGDLQRMMFGFGQAGVAASDVDQILTQWSKRIGEAHTKGGQLADIFKANGLSLTDSEGRLRSSVDLMRDYADLVANAGSEQEQLNLSTIGFGRAGGTMVLVLKDGKAGWDQMMRSINQAGGVLEDEIMRRNAEIDDQFDAMWQTFETSSKRAILTAVAGLASVQEELAKYSRARNAALAGQEIGAMAGDQPTATKGDRLPSPIDQRVAGGFGEPLELSDADKALAAELRRRRAPKTEIPGGGDDKETRARGASTKAIEEQKSAYERLMERLREEEQVLGLSGVALRIKTEQQRANVDASSAEGMAIADLVTHIESQEAAYRAAADAGDFMRDNIRQSFGDLIPQIETGNQALDGFINRLADAATDALFFGSGPLAGLFGGGGGILSIFGGGRAVGGGVDPFKDYLVGENGPEIVRIGSRGGRVGDVPGGAGGGITGVDVDVRLSMDEDGNWKKNVERISTRAASGVMQNGLGSYDRSLPGRINDIMDRQG